MNNNNDAQFDSLIKKMAQDHQPEIPSPGVIWWRAQIQKRLAEKERVERPMVVMRLAAIVVSAVVFVGILAANWPQFLALSKDNAPLLLVTVIAAASVLMTGVAFLLRSSAPRA
jgi:hypothetical protein